MSTTSGSLSPVPFKAGLSLHCGLRFSEITNLTWGDVNLEEGLIFVRDPKNRHNRFAYMTEEVKEVFSDKEPGEPSELVFKDAKGQKNKEDLKCLPQGCGCLGAQPWGRRSEREGGLPHAPSHLRLLACLPRHPSACDPEAPGSQDHQDDRALQPLAAFG